MMLLVLPSGAHAQSATIRLDESQENPDSSHLLVEEQDESEEYTVFVAEIENASDEDILVEQITVDTTISGTVTTDRVIQTAILRVDGEVVETSGIEAKNDGNIVFKDLELYIDSDDSEEVELEVIFKETTGNYPAGTTVRFDIAPADVIAEDENTGAAIPVSKITGTAVSNVHTLSLMGVYVEPISTSASLSATSGDAYGTYTIKFDVTADGQDIFIPTAVSTSTASGVSFAIEGSPLFMGTQSMVLTSTGKVSGKYFAVEDGDTEMFTLTVTANPSQSGSYKVRLKEVRFADAAKAPTESIELSGPDFVTDALQYTETGTGTKGVYRGYMNGRLFIETKSITEADALANCKLNASRNPGSTVRCTWNGKEIYNNESATIRVTAPNGGEKWQIKKINSITWTPYSYNPDVNPSNQVSAYLETKNADGSYKTLGTIVENGKASIHWDGMINKWNNFAAPGTNYYVRVVNEKTGATDRSDKPFTLLAEEKPTITVTAPNGGESWKLKEINTITWKPYSYNPDVNPSKHVTAYLETKNADGSFKTLGKVIENGKASIHWDGMVNSWNNFAAPGSGYYIRVVNEETGATDRSDKPFTLLAPDQVEASLSVASPNGGEMVVAGKATTVKWKQKGIGKLSVALYKNDQWNSWIAKDMTGSAIEKGSYTWTPTQNSVMDLGKVYKIYVTGQRADGTGYIDDKSDSTFSIIPLPAQLSCKASANITLIREGGQARVTWSSTGADYVTFNGEKTVASGTNVVTPTVTTTYTIIAHRGSEQKTCTVGVKVIPQEPLVLPGERPLVLPAETTTKTSEPLVLPSSTNVKGSSFDQSMLSASAATGYEAIKQQLESILKSIRALR